MTPKPKPEKQDKKKRRAPRSERKLLDDECMDILKRLVRLRDVTCVTPSPSCGGYMTASHWQKRGKQATRYDIRNVNGQCSNHNGRHNRWTCYYDAYMLRTYGEAVCLELADRACKTHKWTIAELRDIRDGLIEELGKYDRKSTLG